MAKLTPLSKVLITAEGAHVFRVSIFAKVFIISEGAHLSGMSIFGSLEHLRRELPYPAALQSGLSRFHAERRHRASDGRPSVACLLGIHPCGFGWNGTIGQQPLQKRLGIGERVPFVVSLIRFHVGK